MPVLGSLRKRRFARRMLGYATNPAVARTRSLLGREQHHEIGGVDVVLPPEHHLPFYQRRDPSYDAYAEEVLAALAPRPLTLVDVGANVGDTAVAALSSGDHVRVRCVEGNPAFLTYLRRNVAQFGDRVEVVDRFVGPVGDLTRYTTQHSTGRLVPRPTGPDRAADDGSADASVSWVTPAEVLADIETELAVWKSDLDGLDVHVLAEHWDTIVGRCDVLWFEFDPPAMLADPSDLDRLCGLLGDSDLGLRVYDNLGRPMVRLPRGAAGQGLRDLADWIGRQRAGHVAVPYLDVWAAAPGATAVLDAPHVWR